jgi:hypothetical protein
MISSAMASLIEGLRPTRSFLGVLLRWGLARSSPRAGICIYDACVDECVAVLGLAAPADPSSLREWALMWDDELVERIPSTSATNIEAGLCDRLRELRGSRREAGLARHLKVGYWTISVPFIRADVLTCVVSVRSTGGRGERLVRGQAPEAA